MGSAPAYSRNFGFRSFENIVRDGRFRVPKTGSPLLIGSPVRLDPAAPGFLRVAEAGTLPGPNCGLALYEHILTPGVDPFLASKSDSPFDRVPLGQYAQMVHGVGTKVWWRNTTDKPLYDGRVQGGVQVLDALPAIGDWLIPAASGRWASGGTAANGWLYVEQVNPDTGIVEARFNF